LISNNARTALGFIFGEARDEFRGDDAAPFGKDPKAIAANERTFGPAGQSLAGEVGDNPSSRRVLPSRQFLGGGEDVIVNIERGAQPSEAIASDVDAQDRGILPARRKFLKVQRAGPNEIDGVVADSRRVCGPLKLSVF
jgi:hypothetical protein